MPQTIGYFDEYKVWNTIRNEYVVYLMAHYRQVGNACVPNPLNVLQQCAYAQGPEPVWVNTYPDLNLAGNAPAVWGGVPINPACYVGAGAYDCKTNASYTSSPWFPNGAFYPHTDFEVGDWITYKAGPTAVCYAGQGMQCYKILAVITEAQWGDQNTACAADYLLNGSVGGPCQATSTCNGLAGGPCYNDINDFPAQVYYPNNCAQTGVDASLGIYWQVDQWLNYIPTACTECTTTWNPPPVTYNCELNVLWDPNCPACYDPGDGSGIFTGATALLDCQNSNCGCVFWDCETTTTSGGCVSSYTQSIGSYTSQTDCNLACQSWDCTCNGCEDVTSISGTSGEFSSSGDCLTACTAFGCNLQGQLTNTTRLVFVYDASSMTLNKLHAAYNRTQTWLNNQNFQGEQTHMPYGGEAYLQWWNMLYLGHEDSNKTTANYKTPATGGFVNGIPTSGNWGCNTPRNNGACANSSNGTCYYGNSFEGDFYAAIKWYFGTQGTLFNGNHWAAFFPAGSTGDLTTGNGYIGNSTRNFYGKNSTSTFITGQELKSLPVMSVCDDVLVLYFIDEAANKYHHGDNNTQYTKSTNNNAPWLSQPTRNWQSQYVDFKRFWDNNMSGTTNNGSLRQMLYPFGSGTKGIQKSSFAAIASGNKPIPDGTWLPGTAPNGTGTPGCVPLAPGQAVPLYTNQNNIYVTGSGGGTGLPVNPAFNPDLEVTNPYTILPTDTWCNDLNATNYNLSPSTAGLTNWLGDTPAKSGNTWCNYQGLTHYGFLDQMGWGVNPNANASAIAIEQDVTQYLTAATQTAQTGTCISAHTLADPGSLYPFQTLEECTGGCATYDCTDNGCVMDVSGGGAFNTFASCTASCSSWDCTDTGCTLWNGTLGGGSGGTYYDINVTTGLMACTATCHSYMCEDGCIEQPGTGSTFATLAECNVSCTTWECGVMGCAPGAGGAFTSQTDCDAVCFSWGCLNTGCTWITGTTGAFTSQTECELSTGATGCTSYDCQWNGCVQAQGNQGYYTFLEDCELACISFECASGGCIEQTGNSGTFATSAACTAECISYSCVTTGCTDLIGTGLTNTYTSNNDCDFYCTSFECTWNGCINVGAISGSGGTFSSIIACQTACTSYNCGGNGCYEFNQPGGGGTGGTFSSETQCYDLPCTSWNCSDTGCTEISGTSGMYPTQSACTGACISYNCTDTGCTTQQGSGGTYPDAVDCSWFCVSWDCTDTGCVDVSALSGSGGTFSSLINCEAACTSFECTSTGCIDVGIMSGTGGTFTYETGCTATCVSYNCTDYGCPEQSGTGGTYTASATCTASCQSYECTTGGCQNYNQPFMGTGGTYIELSSCTGTCIAWSCEDNEDLTVTDIYAFYDTTSMGLAEVEQAMLGMEAYIANIPNYNGTLRHGLYNDERWLEWAASVYNDTRPAGNSTPTQNMIAGLIHKAAADNAWTFQNNIYDNCVAGTAFPMIFTNAWVQVNARGPVPTASTNSSVLTVCFIDESGPDNGLGSNLVYTSDDPGPNSNIPQFSGVTTSPLDQPTITWKEDYTAFTQQYNIITGGTGNSNFFLYPTDSFLQLDDNKIFALHSVAAISSGNKPVQDGIWLPGTAPRTAASGGATNSIPDLCSIADLTALEAVNPYFAENFGALDRNGWGVNQTFLPFTTNQFSIDLDTFLSTRQVTGTTCISAATYPHYPNWPHDSLSACTGNCGNWVCQADDSTSSDGCVLTYPGVTVPPGFSTLSACTAACISYNCITTGCTSQVGTGGTYSTNYNCDLNCNSWNCSTWNQSYGPIQTWNGCLPQNGTGGTYTEYTGCTAACISFECTASCETLSAGCYTWANTGGTYVDLTACTGNCAIEWYCTMPEEINSCSSKIILGPSGNLINNGYAAVSPANISTGYGALGWFADNNQAATWSNYSFSMITQPFSNGCEGPTIEQNLGTSLPGWLYSLNSITFSPIGTYSQGVTWPRTYTDWSSLITDFQSIGSPVTVNMTAFDVFQTIQGNNTLWDGLDVTYDYAPCYCNTIECDVFCHDGNTPIPPGAQGPYSSSGAAQDVCCTANTWFCSASTVVSSCSGTTTIPGTYNTNIDAWDYISVNMSTIDLNTLSYESTTPAITGPPAPGILSSDCAGPNGNKLYEILPISYHLLSANTSYNTWDEFVNTLILSGVTGIYPGIQFSILDGYLQSQSGHTLVACSEPCHCITTDCTCYEENSLTGYTTQAECLSGCCPVTAYTATSWNCLSGDTIVDPLTGAISQDVENICTTKNFLGIFNDTLDIIDWHRLFQPSNTMAFNKECVLYDDFGVSLPGYTWTDVNSMMSATTTPWEDCFKYDVGWAFTTYRPYMYVERIGHPAVNLNQGYSTWNAFYTAASALWPTLTPSMSFTGVCAELAAQSGVYSTELPGGNISGCNWTTKSCCLHRGCSCYETFDTTGQYLTEPLCETACCPTTAWTCENAVGCLPIVNYVGAYHPITLVHQTESSCLFYCAPPLSGWNCVSAVTLDSCSASTIITQTTPNLTINSVPYPFTSSTLYNTGYYQPTPVPTTSSGSLLLDYVGMPGQVEAILTNTTYHSATLAFSSVTFELTTASTTWNGLSNSPCSGDNGFNTYRLIGLGHHNVQGGLLFNTWDGFVTQAQIGGIMITNSMNIIDASLVTAPWTLNSPALPLSGWSYSYENCECTLIPCHCEYVENIFQYNTLPDCELNCCPVTYNCDINGCYDPADGSGTFTGATALSDCEATCYEWWCQTATTVTDTCSGVYVNGTFINETRAVFPAPQPQVNFTEYCPYGTGYTTMFPVGGGSPIMMGGINEYSVLMDFGNPTGPDYANPPLWGGNMQSTIFNTIKWLDTSPTNQITDSCPCIDTVPAPCTATNNCVQTCQSGYFSKLSHVVVFSGCDIQYDQTTGNQLNYPDPMSNLAHTPIQSNGVTGFTSWSEMITTLQGAGLPVNLTQAPNTVLMELSQASVAGTGTENLYVMPYKEHCVCMTTECECVTIDGTGHTSTALTYYDSTAYTNCELACCSGVTLEVCDVLITGDYEGVCKYDVANNIVTKLFDVPGFEAYDIATRQNLLWVYNDLTDVIKEYSIFWYGVTFSHMFNRDIFLPNGYLGKGMTATEVPFRLLVGGDAVYEVDITNNVVGPGDITTLFMIPSGLTCTGDILYEESTVIPLIIVTYGSGLDQYVGKFTYSGIKLEESHINTTTGLDVGETFDALFSWDPLASVVPAPVPYSSLLWPLYGITTNKRVYVLQQSPLQFAPAASTTLTLVNQILDKVNGATNLTYIDASDPANIVYQGCHTIEEPENLWWCTDSGCVSNITQPPNSVGSWLLESDCEDHCNFVCGDCAGGCSCVMINTLVSPACNPQPTMGDCILNNIILNTNVINGGETCCDCHACESVTFWEWGTGGVAAWVSVTVNTTITNSTVIQPWTPVYYNVGDVVLFTDPYGNECCYTLVYNHYNTMMTPYDAWQNYLSAYNSNTPMDRATGIWWVACDPDCATIITWDCNDGDRNTCEGLQYWDGAQWTPQENANIIAGLSYTAHLNNVIGTGSYTLDLSTLGWEMGGTQLPVPPDACPGHMGLGFIARITSISYNGTAFTTWATLIDWLNLQNPTWNLSYQDNWQHVVDVCENHYGVECPLDLRYEFCICDDTIPSFASDSCDEKTLLPPAVVGTYTAVEYFQGPTTQPIPPQLNNMRNATFSDYSFFTTQWSLSGQCSYGNTGYYTEYIDKLAVIYQQPASGYLAPNFSLVDTWDAFVSQIMACQIGWPPLNTLVNVNSTFAEISSALLQSTKYKAVVISSACTCVPAPCECIPVIGPGGQYTTSAACSADCCDTSWRCITGSTTGGNAIGPDFDNATNIEYIDVSTLPHWNPGTALNLLSNNYTTNAYGAVDNGMKSYIAMDWISIHHPNTDVDTLRWIGLGQHPDVCTGDSQYSECCLTEPYYPNNSGWIWKYFVDLRMGTPVPSQVTLCNPAQQIFTKYSDLLAWCMSWMPGAYGITIPANVSYTELYMLAMSSTNCDATGFYQAGMSAYYCSEVTHTPCECVECNHPPNQLCPYTSKTECEGTNMMNNSCDNMPVVQGGGTSTAILDVHTVMWLYANNGLLYNQANQNLLWSNFTFLIYSDPSVLSLYNLPGWPTDACEYIHPPGGLPLPSYYAYITSITIVDYLGLTGPAGAVIDGPFTTTWADFITAIQGASWCTNCYLATFTSTYVDVQNIVANNHMELVVNWEFCQCNTTPACCPDITWNCETGATQSNSSCSWDPIAGGQLEIYSPTNPNGPGLNNCAGCQSPMGNNYYVTNSSGTLVQGGGPYIYVAGAESVKYMMTSTHGAQAIPFSARTFYLQSQLAPYTAPGRCMAPLTEFHQIPQLGTGAWTATIDYVTDIQLDICPNNYIPGPQLPIIGVSSNDFAQKLMNAGIGGISLGSDYDQIRQLVIEFCTIGVTGYPNTDDEWISKWVTINTEPCICTSNDPCGCVPVYDGSGQYLTQPDCEVDCECVTWNCTPNGCVDPLNGTGTFSGLTDCQDVCQEYECRPGAQTPMAGPYDCGKLPALPVNGPNLALLNYYGDPTTTPIFPNTVNMQSALIADYKYDCHNCSVSNPNMCDSPHGKWFKGWKITAHMHRTNPTSTALMGAWDSWADTINDLINVWNVSTGFGFGLGWTASQVINCLDQVGGLCSGLPNRVTLGFEMDPCYCNPADCDCVLVPGTGNTGWDMSMYNACTGACCSAESRYDCSINGCYDTLTGIGEFGSLAACTADCREWRCISGDTVPHNWEDCTLKTAVPSILQNNNYSSTIGAGPGNNRLISYMADSANGLQSTPFLSYYVNNDTPYNLSSYPDQCTDNIVFWGNTWRSYTTKISLHDGITLPNAPYYYDWASLIADCQSVGIAISLINTPLQVQAMIGAYYNVPAGNVMFARQAPCLCIENDCNCLELVGTGHTGTIFTTYNDCDIASQNDPCCTTGRTHDLPWICDAHTTPPWDECTCIDISNNPGMTGMYATLQECKDAANCCDPNWYDCQDGGCVGLVNQNVGPYPTAADCYLALQNGDCEGDGWNCVDDSAPGPNPLNPCVYCPIAPCQYNTMTAAGWPYFGNAQMQCVDNCEKECWKCCMTQSGWIYQLLLSANPCQCPEDTIEVPCDGDGPCPYPVSCEPPLVYDWVLCRCVCKPNMSCAPGFHWSYTECKCVPDIIIIHEFDGPIPHVIQDIATATGRPLPQVVTDVNKAVRRLEALLNTGFKGEHCPSCEIPGKKNSDGVCLYDGCLTFEGKQTAGGPCICRKWQMGTDGTNTCVEWSPPGCGDAPFSIKVVFPKTVTPGTPISPGVPGIGGCSLISYQATCPFNTVVDETILTCNCGLIDGVAPTVKNNLNTWVRPDGDTRIYKVIRIIENAEQEFGTIENTFTSTICTDIPVIAGTPSSPGTPATPRTPVVPPVLPPSGPTVGYNCIESGNATKCIAYGSDEYVRIFGTNPPTYSTLAACTAAGCGTPPPEPKSNTLRYVCTEQLNSLVDEYQMACVPTTQIPESVISYGSVFECMNSGCGGWFNCNTDQTLFDVNEPQHNSYPIPMCCESIIKTQTTRLTYENCANSCVALGTTESWFPLYNVIGPNTTNDSPLAYMWRELVNPVIEGACSVSIDVTQYQSKGYPTIDIYSQLPVSPPVPTNKSMEWWQCNHLTPPCFCEPCPYVNGQQQLNFITYNSFTIGNDSSACLAANNCCDPVGQNWFCTISNGTCTQGSGPGGFVSQAACLLYCNPDVWVCTQGACLHNPSGNYPLANQYATQQDCISNCLQPGTKWVCKCLSTPCASPLTSGNHQHECQPRTDGTGYLNTLQECLDYCPCEVTQQAADNPHELAINYDFEKLEACAGHTGYDILPAECMNSENAK